MKDKTAKIINTADVMTGRIDKAVDTELNWVTNNSPNSESNLKMDPTVSAAMGPTKSKAKQNAKFLEERERVATENFLKDFKDIFKKTKDISLLLSKLTEGQDKETLSSALMITLILEIKALQNQITYNNSGHVPLGVSDTGNVPPHYWTTIGTTDTTPFDPFVQTTPTNSHVDKSMFKKEIENLAAKISKEQDKKFLDYLKDGPKNTPNAES